MSAFNALDLFIQQHANGETEFQMLRDEINACIHEEIRFDEMSFKAQGILSAYTEECRNRRERGDMSHEQHEHISHDTLVAGGARS